MLEILPPIVFAAIGYWFGWRGHKRTTRQPYLWSCPREACYFSCGSNDVNTVMAVSDAHEKHHG